MMTYSIIKIYMFVLFLHSLQCTTTDMPTHRNFEIDAILMRIAMKGLGTDKESIVSVVGTTTNAERQRIRQAYEKQYPTDLVNDLEKKLAGDFMLTIVGLMLTKNEFYAKELYDALYNWEVDKMALAEILGSMTRSEIKDVSVAYKYDYGTSLIEDISEKTSNPFKRLLLMLCNTDREFHEGVSATNATRDSQNLVEAGVLSRLQKRQLVIDPEEEALISILTSRSHAQIRKIFAEYAKVQNEGVITTVKRWYLVKSLEFTILTLIRCAYSRIEYYADLLHKNLESFIPNDRQLIRIIVGRVDIDLDKIINAYEFKYKSSLTQKLKVKVFGDHKDMLMRILNKINR